MSIVPGRFVPAMQHNTHTQTHQVIAEKIAGMNNFLTDPAEFFPLHLDRSRPENFKVYEITPDTTVLFDPIDKSQLGPPKIGHSR